MIEMSKCKLLESVQTGYRLFKELLAELGDEQIIQPGVTEKWSAKDIVAHIVIHEQRMIQWISQLLRGDPPMTPQPYAMPEDELAKLNEQIYQGNNDRSLDDIMLDLDETHAKTLALVAAAAEEDILDASRFQLQGGEPLWEAIAANTFWHYEEHGQDIRKWQVAKQDTVREKF